MCCNHSQYIFTNRHYGDGGGGNASFPVGFTASMQGSDWPNIAGGLNANLNTIENFIPNLNADVHRWIRQGLPYDLVDDRNEISLGGFVIDNVAGYTNQQCFNALQSNVRTIPAFRERLLLQNGNNQAANVTDLFFRYGY